MAHRDRMREDRAQRHAERAQRHAEKAQRHAERVAERAQRHASRSHGPHGESRRPNRGERKAVYRSRSGMVFGVCKGVAHHLDVDVFWVRVLTVCATSMTGVWPLMCLYVVAALLMKVEPVLPLETEDDEEFYHSFAASRGMALQRLKRTFDNLDRRIQRIENTVTARDYDWEERLNS